MTTKFYKHRVDVVCNNCGAIISSQKAECISKERRNSADWNQYIDSDTHVDTCEGCK